MSEGDKREDTKIELLRALKEGLVDGSGDASLSSSDLTSIIKDLKTENVAVLRSIKDELKKINENLSMIMR